MDGLFAGLGLDDLEGIDLYEDPNKKKEEEKKAVSKPNKVDEKDLIYDKTFLCPVCDSKFTDKITKTGRVRLLGMDQDLRPVNEGIDVQKYDVIMCPYCSYAALGRYFPHVSTMQAKLIRENISVKVIRHKFEGEVCSYEEAIERYKLALANAVVKRAKNSEKAYICLKSAWLFRGYAQALEEDPSISAGELKHIREMEEVHIQNAYKGFAEAIKSESFPMCGMDEITFDYLFAALALRCKDYENASRLVSKIITSANANARIKDKARDLKEEILAAMKKSK